MNYIVPVLLVCLVPFVVYFSVKLGTYAYLRAKYLFEKEQKESQNGHQENEV